MINAEALILFESDLNKQTKSNPISWKNFSGDIWAKCLTQELVLYIDDQGNTTIVKNRYGNCVKFNGSKNKQNKFLLWIKSFIK